MHESDVIETSLSVVIQHPALDAARYASWTSTLGHNAVTLNKDHKKS
jgi:hypothetical protein